MQLTLKEAADLVGGIARGSDQLVIRGAGTLSSARSGEITFVESQKVLSRLSHSFADAVLVPSLDLAPDDRAYIQVDNVREAFATLVEHFHPPRVLARIGISPRAVISESAKVGNDVDVHAGAVVQNEVEIGDGCTIHANVTIMDGCRIAENVIIYPGVVLYPGTIVGPRCILHANCVLGSYGFGYDTVDGQHHLGAQLGYVELEADVELGAATTVDRGSYGATTVGAGTKVDNNVQIAHNCRIGRHNILCSQVGIAGSSSTGDYVVMAGQVGIPDHVHIGDQVTIGAKSGVMRDVPNGQTMLGIPATPERSQMQQLAALQRLPQMRKQVRALQRKMDEMSEAQAALTQQEKPAREAA